jgi:hypothetical protein
VLPHWTTFTGVPLPPCLRVGNQIKGIKLDGKAYSRDGDSDRYFSKHILSQHIDKNAQKFEFTGLAPILERISAVIHSHHTRGAAQAVAA